MGRLSNELEETVKKLNEVLDNMKEPRLHIAALTDCIATRYPDLSPLYSFTEFVHFCKARLHHSLNDAWNKMEGD